MARARVALPGKEVGTIEILAGDVIPDGYMLCDGSILNKADHPKLFAKIGAAWGEPDVDTFHLPDLRGKFLRGVDGTAGLDPDKASRTASNAGGNVGDNVGSVQGDAIRNIEGSISVVQFRSTPTRSGAFNYTNTSNNSNASGSTAAGTLGFSASNVVPTGGDNRPINANVNYIIKVI